MTLPAAYRKTLRDLLTPAERRVFEQLSSPEKIQDFLDRMPVNFEIGGETHMSPRRVLHKRRAHCTEGALLAAACFAFHGLPPLLMDLRALPADQDHVVALFQVRGLWGAISKTNHAVLRWRDPLYRNLRELAMSYAHEYFLPSGRKSLLSYSARPFSLTRYAARRWVTAEDDLDWLIAALDDAPHEPVAPAAALAGRRRASPIERHSAEAVDWRAPGRIGPPRSWKPSRTPR